MARIFETYRNRYLGSTIFYAKTSDTALYTDAGYEDEATAEQVEEAFLSGPVFVSTTSSGTETFTIVDSFAKAAATGVITVTSGATAWEADPES